MNKEQIYDAQIGPLMTQIIEVCRANGIGMIASFAIENEADSDLRCTTHLHDGNGKIPFRSAYNVLLHGRVPPMHLTTKDAEGKVTSMTTVLG